MHILLEDEKIVSKDNQVENLQWLPNMYIENLQWLPNMYSSYKSVNESKIWCLDSLEEELVLKIIHPNIKLIKAENKNKSQI